MQFIAVLIISSLIIGGCQQPKKPNVVEQQQITIMPGEDGYKKYCSACHGKKGNLGIAGATDLQLSVLDIEEVVKIIKEGKNSMPAMENRIPGTEIEKIALYTMKFRKINNEEE